MKSEALKYFSEIDLTTFALVLFLLVFLTQFIRLFLNGQKESFDRAANMPLEETKYGN